MALTMDQLNAVYNDMSVYGDTYKNSVAPMAVNTNVASIPNVAQINNIQPYLPIINQGGNDGGITTINNRIDSNDPTFRDPFNDILENYIQKNEVNPNEFLEKYSDDMFNVQETKSKGIGIQTLIDAYKKFSPIGMIYKAGNNIITNTQKYFADKKENERLEALAQIEQARKQKEAQATIAAAEEKSKQIAANRIQAANEQNRTGGYQAGYGSDFMGGGGRDRGNDPSSAGGSDTMGSFKKGGRTGYGTGGIVTL